jgi:hypothetical protein
MTDRWQEINRLYNAAVEVEEKDRTSFLEEACGEDSELRREVESLLAYDQPAQQFIDRPAMQMAAEKLAVRAGVAAGKKTRALPGSGFVGFGRNGRRLQSHRHPIEPDCRDQGSAATPVGEVGSAAAI